MINFKKNIKTKEEGSYKDIALNINADILKENNSLLKNIKSLKDDNKELKKKNSDLIKEDLNSDRTDKEESGSRIIKKILSDGRSQGVSWVKEYWERVLVLTILGALEFFLTKKEKGVEFMKNLSDISKDFLPEYFFITILYIISIVVALTFYLPTKKLRNAKKGLKRFEIKELDDYITKFEEIHNEIKETEGLESDFSKRLSKRAILKNILYSKDIKIIEEDADEVWVTSKDLVFDTDSENMAFVKKNIANGTEYHWLVPEDIDNHLIDKMEKNFINEAGDELKGYSFHKVERKGWMLAHDVVIYNPGHATKGVEVYEFTFDGGGIIQLPPGESQKALRMAMKAIINDSESSLN